MQGKLGAAHRGGRQAQLRVRGLEEELLAVQGDSSKLNSQASDRGVECCG